MPPRVLVDANVLFSRTLRDWLGQLYLHSDSFFSVYWTEDILAETIYHLRREHPEWSGSQITIIRDRIADTFEGGRVEDFTPDGTFPGSDPHDEHVHAAAVACQAQYLLTRDAGFHDLGVADQLPYEVYTPDDFFLLIDQSAPHVVKSVTSDQQAYWQARGGRCNLPRSLTEAGCPEFADRVRGHLRRLE